MTIKYLLVQLWVSGISNDVIRTGLTKFQLEDNTFLKYKYNIIYKRILFTYNIIMIIIIRIIL